MVRRFQYGDLLWFLEEGQLYTWGWDGNYISIGGLGHDKRSIFERATIWGGKGITRPKLVEALRGVKVKFVSGGAKHTAAITGIVVTKECGFIRDLENGELYTWGFGDWGRLGHGNNANQVYPKRLEFFGSQTRIAKVNAGDKHSAAVTETGELYVWGKNDQYQLGFEQTSVGGSNFDCVTEPTELPLIRKNSVLKERFKDVVCGEYMTCAITGLIVYLIVC